MGSSLAADRGDVLFVLLVDVAIVVVVSVRGGSCCFALLSVDAGCCCTCPGLCSAFGPGHPHQSSRRRLITLLPHLADSRQHAPTGIRTPRHWQDDPSVLFLPVGAGRCYICLSPASGSRPRPGYPRQSSRRRLIPVLPHPAPADSPQHDPTGIRSPRH
ncbi:hypothetical protein C8Q76DRAFT_301665 [Earliella scabrosa]|nr:hypothetical protein C8Q76DRAFT_301665 [Earliella scabrosa]